MRDGFFYWFNFVESADFLFTPSAMIRNIFFLFLFSISFASCEKDIKIKLDPTSTDLVVDASIENGQISDGRVIEESRIFQSAEY